MMLAVSDHRKPTDSLNCRYAASAKAAALPAAMKCSVAVLAKRRTPAHTRHTPSFHFHSPKQESGMRPVTLDTDATFSRHNLPERDDDDTDSTSTRPPPHLSTAMQRWWLAVVREN